MVLNNTVKTNTQIVKSTNRCPNQCVKWSGHPRNSYQAANDIHTFTTNSFRPSSKIKCSNRFETVIRCRQTIANNCCLPAWTGNYYGDK